MLEPQRTLLGLATAPANSAGAAPHDPLVGVDLGPYRVVRRIGEGAAGSVYHATHGALGSAVAIKVLARQRGVPSGVAVERLRREAFVMANLDHPNVARVIDVGTVGDGRLYVVMEHLQGETLRARLERDRWLWPVEAVRIAMEVADALAAAHDQGVVHRDLSPGNVFLAITPSRLRRRVVKLLDFGLARLLHDGASQLTSGDSLLGTPYYMAPEQWASARVDHRADLYGLGAMLYEMLLGEPPFPGPHWLIVRQGHMREPVRLPSSLVGPERSPAALDRLILALLAKVPDERPGSAAEVFDALAAIEAAGLPLSIAR